MMIAFRVARGVTGHFLIRFIEWLSAAILLNFGVTLLRSGSTFSTSHAYDMMAYLATENVWGWAMTILAGLRLFALFVNGTFNWFAVLSPWARVVTAFLSAFVWFATSASLLWSGVPAPGVGTYGMLMLSDIFFAGIIARDAACIHARGLDGRAGVF